MWINSRFAKEQQSKKKRMQGDKAVTRSIPIDIVESVLMRMNPKERYSHGSTLKLQFLAKDNCVSSMEF